MSNWYFVRHGETKWNAEQRVQGHTDVPLHDAGRAQIAKTAARLASVRFDAVYASDLSRARETANIIVEANAAGPQEVRIDPLLREVSFGEFEGMTWDEIANVESERLSRGQRDLDYSPRGGESYRALLDRLGEFAEGLHSRHSHEDVLVVGHGGALRALIVRLLDLPYEAYWALTGLGSGSISRIRKRFGYPALVGWNDVGHLDRSLSH